MQNESSEGQELRWDGIVTSGFLTEEGQHKRHRLSDAAKNGQWAEMLDIVSECPDWVNGSRLNGTSLYTPLHQAAYGGAPLKVVERLIEIGAWRTLQNAKGERALDVALRQQHSHLFSLLTPKYKRLTPSDTLLKIQQHFHAVIRGRIQDRVRQADELRLPELEPILEFENARVWFAVPGMYGGFHYWLEGEGNETILISESWCRIAGGSGQRHEVTSQGSRLVDEGFV